MIDENRIQPLLSVIERLENASNTSQQQINELSKTLGGLQHSIQNIRKEKKQLTEQNITLVKNQQILITSNHNLKKEIELLKAQLINNSKNHQNKRSSHDLPIPQSKRQKTHHEPTNHDLLNNTMQRQNYIKVNSEEDIDLQQTIHHQYSQPTHSVINPNNAFNDNSSPVMQEIFSQSKSDHARLFQNQLSPQKQSSHHYEEYSSKIDNTSHY